VTGNCTYNKTNQTAFKNNGSKGVQAGNESQLIAALRQRPVSVAIAASSSYF